MASMRRNILVALVALCLGVVAIFRGQRLLGVCFLGIGLLRIIMLLQGRRPHKPEPSIRLNLENDSPDADGSKEK
jgi:hypothetical protein